MVAEAEETPEQKIVRLEAELAKSRRIVAISMHALAFTQEIRGRLRIFAAVIADVKNHAGRPERVLNMLAKMDADLERYADLADQAMRAYWDRDKTQNSA